MCAQLQFKQFIGGEQERSSSHAHWALETFQNTLRIRKHNLTALLTLSGNIKIPLPLKQHTTHTHTQPLYTYMYIYQNTNNYLCCFSVIDIYIYIYQNLCEAKLSQTHTPHKFGYILA